MAPENVTPAGEKRPVPKRLRRRRLRRRLVIAGGIALVLVVGLFLLLPVIAGSYAPKALERGLNQAIKGTAEVGGTSFSWFGSQEVGPIIIKDDAGEVVARLELELMQGLWSLGTAAAGFGNLDLGRAELKGDITVVRYADGSTNLEQVFEQQLKPTPSGKPKERTKLPPTLSGSFVIDALDVRFIDMEKLRQQVPAAIVRLPNLTGQLAIADGSSISADLTSDLAHASSLGGAEIAGGSFKLTGSVAKLTDVDGFIVPEQAVIDARLDATDVAIIIADTLADMDNALASALGQELQAEVRASGSLSAAKASVKVTTTGASADAEVAIRDGILTTPRPALINASGLAVTTLTPGLAQSLEGSQRIRFDGFPDVRISLADLSLKVPTGGDPLDLRGVSFDAALTTTEARGTVQVPDGQEGSGQQQFTITPLTARITAQDVAQRVTIQAQTTATLAERPAGRIKVDLVAIDPLDAEGQLRAGIPGQIEGVVEVEEFATAIADPLVSGLGIDLTTDIGPTLNLTARASTAEATAGAGTPGEPGAAGSASGSAPSTVPATNLTLNLASANLQAQANVSYDNRVLRAGDNAVQLQMQRAGPLLDRLIESGQVEVSGAGPISVTASNLLIDMDRLRAEGATDLRAIAGVLNVETGPATGTLTLMNRPQQQWSLEPITATINAARIARGVNIRARTAAALDGQPAGMLNVDMVATELFTETGQMASTPLISGRAVLQKVTTSAIQPWAEELGLDLPAGIGPHIDLAITARSGDPQGGGQGGAGEGVAGARVTELDLTVRSPHFTGDGLLTLAEGSLLTRGDGIQFVARRPGALLGPAARNAGMEISQAGQIRLSARGVRIPYSGEAPLQQAAADIQVETGGYAIRPIVEPVNPAAGQAANGQQPAPATPASAQPTISLSSITAAATLRPNQAPQVQLQGGGTHQGAEFSMRGDLALPGALTGTMIRPLGTFELRNVPTTLAAMIPGISADQGELSPTGLIREIAGQSLTLIFAAQRPQGAAETARALNLQVESQGLNGRAQATLTEAEFTLAALDFRAQVSAGLAERLMASLGSDLAQPPQLDGPAMVVISGTPFSVPLTGTRPDLQRAGNATFRIGLEGTTTITNLMVATEEGSPPRDVGPIGVRDLLIEATVPVASLAPEGPQGEASARLRGELLGADGEPFVNLAGNAEVPVAGAAPQGELNAELTLHITDTRRVDTLLNRQGLLADGIGEEARVILTTDMEFAPEAEAARPQGAVQQQRQISEHTTIHAAIDSPKLRTAEPLHLNFFPDRIELGHAAQISWLMEPAWANWYLLQAGEVAADASELARFITPAEVKLQLERLTLGRGEGVGPMAPGIFALDGQVSSAGARMSIGGVPAQFAGLLASLRGGDEPGTISFALRVQDAGGGAGPEGQPAIDLTGEVFSLADETGQITQELSLITAAGQARNVPTPLIDAAARQGGLLTEALGPMANAQLQLQSLAISEGAFVGGNVDVVFTSDRAELQIAGTIHDATLIAEGATTAMLREITPALGARLFTGVPLIGQFEKSAAQAPATLTANNLTVPLDGNLSHLNGDFVLDAGEASFTTSNIFGKLLKFAGQRSAGVVGRRIEPFRATFRNGAASYERFTLPMGEFTIDTTGSFDLVAKRLNVVTYVPFGALTDEAAGLLSTGLGRLIGGALPTIERATMVPIRTSGSFENPSTTPDVELFVQQTGKTLLRPDKLIGGSIRDIFDKLNPRRNEPPTSPAPAEPGPSAPPAGTPSPGPGGGGGR